MIRLSCFLIAEYASITADGRMTVAGTFDNLDVQLPPNAPAEALQQIPFRGGYVAVVSEASIADGLSHQMRFRILSGNGAPIVDDLRFTVNYALNPYGRPMRNHLVISLNGLILPGPDDYVFELSVDGQSGALGEFTFSVTEKPPQQDA